MAKGIKWQKDSRCLSNWRHLYIFQKWRNIMKTTTYRSPYGPILIFSSWWIAFPPNLFENGSESHDWKLRKKHGSTNLFFPKRPGWRQRFWPNMTKRILSVRGLFWRFKHFQDQNSHTLPETHSKSPWQIDGWKAILSFLGLGSAFAAASQEKYISKWFGK